VSFASENIFKAKVFFKTALDRIGRLATLFSSGKLFSL
jgi:hypothetical protein